MGRKAPVAGIERLAGPTIAAVPVRVRLTNAEGKGEERDWTCEALLRRIQDAATAMIPHEHSGLSAIARVSEEAQQACRFQTMLVVQPPETGIADSSLFLPNDVSASTTAKRHTASRYDDFNVYALMVVCTVGVESLHVEFSFDERVIERAMVQCMARHFGGVVNQLCDLGDLDAVNVSEVSTPTGSDLIQCWKWNASHPVTHPRCVHDIITETALQHPNATAISAWDGERSYKQLDHLSTLVAGYLRDVGGVERGMIVPLCFEKSMWMPIAFLGVIKAGAAGLLLDPTLPVLRLEVMLERVGARNGIIVSSVASRELAGRLMGRGRMVVLGPDADVVRGWEDGTISDGRGQERLPVVDPADLLYIIFTSGSSGTPKGCMIQHRNFSSAMAHQQDILNLTKNSRVYDFSSYAFDATYWSTSHVLSAGGTLCIPSDEERSSSLADSIHAYRTTHIFLTPATARTLDSLRVPELKTIYIGGEEVLKTDIVPWLEGGKDTFVVYGPSECFAISLYWRVPSLDLLPPKLSIGNGQGIATWIVDPRSNGKELSPLGAIGELYLEGPLVGQGYLGDERQTAASFLTDAEWLVKGAPDGSGALAGRKGRVYRTGDLVRYKPFDGTIVFVGRSDTLKKLRGQRVELSEVEHHVRCCGETSVGSGFVAVSEIVVPRVTGKAVLVVFVQRRQGERGGDFAQLTNRLHIELPERLPSFMVPTDYIPVEEIPMSAGGKVDRKRLQTIGADIDVAQLMLQEESLKDRAASTESEIRLQQLWETVLDIRKEKIYAESSFLRLGGDSIAAGQQR